MLLFISIGIIIIENVQERGISMKKNTGAIYDAKTLGKPKMILLGVQHMFAMFGATILVPIITGLDISTTLLMAGLGTLLFHLLTIHHNHN